MACLSAITQVILNDCTNVPSAGLEPVAWIFNRAGVTWTVDGSNDVLITAGANEVGEQAWTATAVKKENNAGFDAVIADNLPDLFTHFVSLQPYERDSDAIKNIDEMDDIIVVVELKGPKDEGCFIMLGVEHGLHKITASARYNDNNGIPTYEFATREGEGEKYSRYIFWDTDYATTKADLVALETPGV